MRHAYYQQKGSTIHHRGEWLGWLIVTIAALFYCYEYFLRIAPGVMASQIRSAFQIDATGFGVLLGFYYYAYTPLQLPVGILVDRFGPRRLLFVACLLCVVGAFMFGNPQQNIIVAHAGRFLVGFGSAFAFVSVLKLASTWLPSRYFALVTGLVVSLGMIGAMLGDMALPIWLESLSWNDTVIYSAYVGIVIALLIILFIRDKRSSAKPFPTQQMNVKGLIVDFVKLLGNANVWINGLIGCLLYLSLTVFAEAWGIEFLQTVHGFSHKNATWANAMVFLGFAIGGPIVGIISERIRSRRKPMIIGSVIATAICAVIIYAENISVPMVYVLLFSFGFFTSAQVLIFAVARELFPKRLTGSALAMTNMMVMVGGMIFQPLTATLIDIHWGKTLLMENGLRVYVAADFQYAMNLMLACFVLNIVLCLILRETYES